MLAWLVVGAGVAAAGAPAVTLLPPPGSTVVAVSVGDQVRIRRTIQEKLVSLEQLTGIPARPVAVIVFGTREEYMTFTQIPPDFGAVTRDGVILMQPVEMLDRRRGLRQILEHEAVHHHFFRVGAGWPRNFHEALAHLLSGGRAVESPRARELAGRERTGAEEAEYEAHLAWLLRQKIGRAGVKAFLSRVLAGEVDLAEFRRKRAWYAQF